MLDGALGVKAAENWPPVHRERFLASPGTGQAVLAATFYPRSTGLELFSLHQTMSRSDTVDRAVLRVSPDHGRTWEVVGEEPVRSKRPDGIQRRALRGGVVDPASGRFVCFWISALLPNDDPLEGMRRWTVGYRVSADGGRTWLVDEPVIQSGPEFSRVHPLPGVTVGRNAVMIGDLSSVPIVLEDGTLLVPVIVTPTGPDGNYHNPGGGYTYSDGAALRGRWRSDGRIDWELSARIAGDPSRSTRGMDEPTFAVLADGRIMAVLRGSNGGKPALPGRRWVAFSADGGRTWTAPQPWSYAEGGEFFSPSSCSQLVHHSSGRMFWIGNISPTNPNGNRPRYPLVLGEVDRASGLLRRATVRPIDDRGPDDAEQLMLSNFCAREDRETGEIVVHLTRLFARSVAPDLDWTADAWLYRIPVGVRR